MKEEVLNEFVRRGRAAQQECDEIIAACVEENEEQLTELFENYLDKAENCVDGCLMICQDNGPQEDGSHRFIAAFTGPHSGEFLRLIDGLRTRINVARLKRDGLRYD